MPTACIVGSGPNGLAAAITLARTGVQVKVLEAAASPGGGLRSFRNDRYGTLHDRCSAVHPLAIASPFFRSIGLHREVDFINPPKPWAQAVLNDSTGKPEHRLNRLASSFAGVAAHAMLPPHHPLALGTGALLGGVGLSTGWKIPRGGSQSIADFLLKTLYSYGGIIDCNSPVDPHDLPDELEAADLVLWDTDATTATLAACPGQDPPARRYGPGAAKADFVTDAPIPWSNPNLHRAGTVHLGGSWATVFTAEKAVNSGQLPAHPFVLVSQPSLFDPTRAPAGLHTVWAYAHVPNNSSADPAEIITREIERFAPGFAATVLATSTRAADQFANYNPNYVGGDISTGAMRGGQLLTSGTLRAEAQQSSPWQRALSLPDRLAAVPWSLPRKGWYLCSATTPPGPGVHGMSGYLAARLALRELARA